MRIKRSKFDPERQVTARTLRERERSVLHIKRNMNAHVFIGFDDELKQKQISERYNIGNCHIPALDEKKKSDKWRDYTGSRFLLLSDFRGPRHLSFEELLHVLAGKAPLIPKTRLAKHRVVYDTVIFDVEAPLEELYAKDLKYARPSVRDAFLRLCEAMDTTYVTW